MKGGVVAVALAGALLAGCASPPAEFSASAASELQERVLAVTEASSSGDVAAALLRLQELEVAAYGAAARSLISSERLASILASIALVRADLERLLSAAELAQLQDRLKELEGRQSEQAAGAGGSAESSGTDSVRTDAVRTGSGAGSQAADESAAGAATEQTNAEEKIRKAEQKAEERAAKQREQAAKRAAKQESKGKGRG